MFTFIELGAGVAIGFQEREKELEFLLETIFSRFLLVYVSGLAFVSSYIFSLALQRNMTATKLLSYL